MERDDFEPLSASELADIDAQYVEFPAFADWPSTIPRPELWKQSLQSLSQASKEANEDELRRAREVVLRTAAFDTGAIEDLYSTDRGLTFTVATQMATWEQEVEERSPDALALFRAQLEAFELVLDLATGHFPEITQSWIRRIHEVVTAPQETYVVHTPVGPQRQPLPKGDYKKHPNHVKTADGRIHAYAPVELTHPEMQRFVDELGRPEFKSAHPAVQASYAHYCLTAIHPFADGNGRVARSIASAYTYRAASIPLLVLAHQRDQYFEVLAEADSGRAEKFVGFIGEVAHDGMEMVIEGLKSAKAPQPNALLDEFRSLYLAQGELSHQELDRVAESFAEDLYEILSEQVGALSVPDGVEISVVIGQGNPLDPPDGFRTLVSPRGRYLNVELASAPPAAAKLSETLQVFVSTESDTGSTVMLKSAISGEEIVLGLMDLRPQLSVAGRYRISSFVQRGLGQALRQLLVLARKRLGRTGYGPI